MFFLFPQPRGVSAATTHTILPAPIQACPLPVGADSRQRLVWSPPLPEGSALLCRERGWDFQEEQSRRYTQDLTAPAAGYDFQDRQAGWPPAGPADPASHALPATWASSDHGRASEYIEFFAEVAICAGVPPEGEITDQQEQCRAPLPEAIPQSPADARQGVEPPLADVHFL